MELVGTFERDWTSQVEACDVSDIFWQVWPEICRDYMFLLLSTTVDPLPTSDSFLIAILINFAM